MKSDTIAYGIALLSILDENENISFTNLEELSLIKGKELRELLKYLVKKEYVKHRQALFVNTTHISDDKIKLDHNGMEVILGEREYFDNIDKSSQEIHNQMVLHGSPNSQIAQNTGDNSPVTQIQDNIQVLILNKIIDDDLNLDNEKKGKLKKIVSKIGSLVKTGESAEKIYSWMEKGVAIAPTYLPLLISLLK